MTTILLLPLHSGILLIGGINPAFYTFAIFESCWPLSLSW